MRAGDRKRSSGGTPGPYVAPAASPSRSLISWPSLLPPRLAGEGHAEEFEHSLALLVGLRRRHDADLQPAETVHLVVVDLRERKLLPEPQRVVAAPVERLGRHSVEVADSGQRDAGQPLEEVPHPLAPQGHAGADRVAGAKP